jgi:imidazolonepropionase-like amidohydrolase
MKQAQRGHRPWRPSEKTLFAVVVAMVVVSIPIGRTPVALAQSTDLAIVGGTLIDGTGAAPRPSTTVILSGGRIARIGPSASTPPPAGAQVISAEGKYVIPGLWDAHIHSRDFYAELLITHGITAYVDWSGSPLEWTLAQRDAIAKGEIYGPRFFTAGQLVADNADPAAARAQVRQLKERGVDMISVGFGLKKESLLAVIDEAKKVGLPSSGYPLYTREAIEAGISGIKHTYTVGSANVTDPAKRAVIEKQLELEEGEEADARLYALGNDYDELVALMAKHKTTWIPTLVKDFKVSHDRRDEFELEAYRLLSNPNLQYLPILNMLPQLTNEFDTGIAWVASGNVGTVDKTSPDWELWRQGYKNLQGLIRKLVAAGVHVLPGTAPHSYVMPGLGMHQELQLLVDAGMTPMQALQSATLWSAEFVRKDKELGTVEQGKIADVVVLKQNPLDNVRNLRSIDTVIQGGRVQPIGYHWYYTNPLPRMQTPGPPGEGPRAPQLTAIAPAVTAESKGVTLTLRGANFVRNSVAFLDGRPLATTYVSPAELKAVVPAELTRIPGAANVRVRTPRPGGGESAAVQLTVRYE